jgi:hypothetical protein
VLAQRDRCDAVAGGDDAQRRAFCARVMSSSVLSSEELSAAKLVLNASSLAAAIAVKRRRAVGSVMFDIAQTKSLSAKRTITS